MRRAFDAVNGASTVLVSVAAVLAAGFVRADGTRRPMALMVMFDGMRADAIEAAEMPNLAKLRAGTWQEGYRCAWSVTGQTDPVAAPNSAPNHAAIATGVISTKHGVTANGTTKNGNYSLYPTWMKRVVDARRGTKGLFVYSWSEDAELGPAEGVTFLGKSDAENAVDLAALLASEEAPDATLYFIDLPDHGGHNSGFYPHSSAYLASLAESDSYLGNCLKAIASRPTFAEEDWLIMVTGDHGGYGTNHGQTSGRQAHTVPVILSGRNVTPGRLPGLPYNFDLTASALAHFGIDPVAAGLDATALDHLAVTDAALTLDDGLAVYLPFEGDADNRIADGPSSELLGDAAVTANGFVGNFLNIPSGGYVKLPGTESLTYEGDDKSFTVIVWVRMGTQSGDSVIFGNQNWAKGINPGMLLCASRKESASTAGVVMNAGSGGTRQLIGTFDYESTSYWTFYAVTRTDEGVFTTYQGRNDGTLNWAAAPFDAFVFKTGFPFCIGQDGTGEYSKKFVGAVDDFALWTRGMTHEEIRRIYECGRAGMPLADLLAIDANDAPTMAVTALDTDSCTLTFGGRRTRTFQLCVASGVADAAGDKYAWETFTFLAAITPNQTAYTYTIPETFKQNRSKFRFFLLQTDDLPYVQEVQHVQSGGGAFIDTGIAPRRTLSATFDIQLTEQNGKWDWMFGAMGTTDKKSNFGIARFQDNGYWHIEVSGDNQRPYLCTLNEPHHVVFTPAVITMDGKSHTSGTTASTFIESGWTINLFRNLKMGAPYDQTMRGWYTAFTLATPKRTARDFTPVTDGEGTAGLFDAVTGRFLASGGDPLAAGDGQDPARFGWVRAQSETFNANTDVPDTAGWIGTGDITDLVDPANWACTNRFGKPLPGALPTAETTLLVGGPTTFAVPAGKMPTCKAILFDNAQLTADADWCGLDFDKVLPESVIDLDGYRLTLAGPDGETAAPFTITDASTDADAPGELHIIVAEGANYVNSGIRFNGNLRLVKEGTGTYSSTFNAHTYSGGTYVAEGTVRPSTTVNRQFGLEGSTIQVAKGATLDIWSRYFSRYAIQLDGGTLTNTYNPMTANADADIGNLTLTDDARFVFADITKTHDITVATGSVWNLGGHTLTLSLNGNDPDFTVNNGVVISNGTLIIDVVRADGRGWLQNKGLIGKDELNLDLGVSPLRLKGNSSVFDFTTRSPHADVHSAEGCTLDIYGTFKPDSAYGFNMRMMNGSTLNLTGKTEPWPTLFSHNTSYNNCTLDFESGATVTVDLHGRVFGGLRTQILSWPEPPEHVTFRFDPETAAFYTPHADAEGLWIVPTGIVIFLK